MLRTAFVKYLYLLDVYYAEENNGRTLSGWDWRFLHFGPFTAEAVRISDTLVEAGAIRAEEKESVEGNKDFILYDLAEHRRARNLRSIGISGSIELRIQADMRRYGTDLPRLLDYVYFRTEPMTNASPGQVLDFRATTNPDWRSHHGYRQP